MNDASEIYNLLNNTHELRGFSEGEAYSKSWLAEVIKEKKRNIFLIAEKDGIIVGFLIAHRIPDKDFLLNDVYVKPEFRGQGIADGLMLQFDKIIKLLGSNFSLGLVLPGNKKMQGLFEKRHYKRGHTFYYYYKERK